MATVATVNTLVRTLMGDDDTAVYLDATILPAVNQAYRLVQQKLVNRGCSVLRDTSAVLTVPAGTTLINASSTPALPTDFMVPYKIWEKPSGSATSEFRLMETATELPNRSQFDYLGDWTFEAGGIDLVGATAAVDIKMQYERLLPSFTASSDTIGILGAEDAIAFYATAYMANSRGQDPKYFEAKGDQATDELITRFTHSNQHIHGRRRLPYGRRASGR